MDQNQSHAKSSPTTKPTDFVRAGQATILAICDEMVDAAAHFTALILARQPQPGAGGVTPSIQRQGNHVWVGL